MDCCYFAGMKKRLLFAVLAVISMTSCKSEYEERMEKAREIKCEMERLTQQSQVMGLKLDTELNELESQIEFHAKVSGNKDLFLKELFY